MKKINLKKINAVLTLVCIILAADHMIFMGFEMIHSNGEALPMFSSMPMVPFFILVGAHAALSMGIFFLGNTESGKKYPKKNPQTVEQRIAAIALVICIVLHYSDIRFFHIAGSAGMFAKEILLVIATVSHIQASVDRVMITLGVEKKIFPIIIRFIVLASAVVAVVGLVKFCF